MSLITQLVESLRCLPGVGPKSAQRMAFHLLERDRNGAEKLSESLVAAVRGVGNCEQCRTLSDATVCPICTSSKRDRSQLCIVETPSDVEAVEAAAHFSGVYFVLMGHLSPIDGIGPEQLGLDRLEARLKQGDTKELILATNPTVEGEATAHYVSQIAHDVGVRVTRIAHGVPLGGELEYIDSGTLSHAFHGRQEV